MESAFVPGAEAPILNGLRDVELFEQELPWQERYPIASSYGLFVKAAEKYRDDIALRLLLTGVTDETPIDISYKSLLAKITQTGNCLRELGVGKNDVVGIMLTNLLQTHYSVWGSQLAGIAAPLNPLLEPVHLIEIVNTTKAKVLITMAPISHDPDHWQRVEALLEGAPTIKTLMLVEVPGYTDVNVNYTREGVRVIDFNTAIAQHGDSNVEFNRDIASKDIAAYFHTGGTTGRPKIAQVTHGNIAFCGQIYENLVRYKGRIVGMTALPLFHIYGLIAAGIGPLYAGRTLVMMTPEGFRNPNVLKNWWHHCSRLYVNAFASVPTILAALMELPSEQYDLSKLEDVGSGAAPLPKRLRKDFQDKFDVNVTNGWGMTETCSLGTRQRAECPAPEGSVGTRFPYGAIRTVVLEGNKVIRDCAPNESGVLIIKGPNIFQGYLHPEDDAKAWVDGDWFNTGDVAFIDEEGFVTLTGRAKDLIIRGGHNIDPITIEEPLSKHPAVAQVVAIGQPDTYAGELPIAYVQLKESEENKTSVEELLEFAKNNIGERAAIPKRIELIDEFPVTAVGKFFKPELRNRATRFVMSQTLADHNIAADVKVKFTQNRGHVAEIHLHEDGDLDRARELLEKYPVVVEFA